MNERITDSDRGRLPNTAERYAALPDTTRRWIESLREDDIEKINGMRDFNTKDIENLKAFRDLLSAKGIDTIRASLEMFENVRTANRFIKWGLAATLGVFTLTAAIITVLTKVWAWTRHGGTP